MPATINENTIKKLKSHYEKTKEIWEEYVSQIEGDEIRENFKKYFHIRPTSSYYRLVCTFSPCFAMRTVAIEYKANHTEYFDNALKLLKDNFTPTEFTKDFIKAEYGFVIYSNNKNIREYDIQALFIHAMRDYDMKLLATEFNIMRGGRQKVDIVAKKDNEIWLIEVKHGDEDTDAEAQVNAYKRIFENNRNVIFSLLKNATHAQLVAENYAVKTAVVYTTGSVTYSVDRIWKYNFATKSFDSEK